LQVRTVKSGKNISKDIDKYNNKTIKKFQPFYHIAVHLGKLYACHFKTKKLEE